MLCDDLLEILKAHKKDLARYGVKSIAIFGSIARNQQTHESDVDVLVELESGIGVLEFIKLKNHIETILRRPVDLVTQQSLHPMMKNSVINEAIYAYQAGVNT